MGSEVSHAWHGNRQYSCGEHLAMRGNCISHRESPWTERLQSGRAGLGTQCCEMARGNRIRTHVKGYSLGVLLKACVWGQEGGPGVLLSYKDFVPLRQDLEFCGELSMENSLSLGTGKVTFVPAL